METRTDVRADELIVDDTRSVNSPPSYYYDKGSKVISEFKNCSTVGLPSDETYCTVVTVCPWTDDSGGAVTQTAFVGNTKYTRKSISDSEWGDWCVDVIIDNSKILPYTAANGWTRIERYSIFPPQDTTVPDGKNAARFYLLAAIGSGSTDTSYDVTGAQATANSPVIVYGGFSYLNLDTVGCHQNGIFIPYNSVIGGSSDGYILVNTSMLAIKPYTGIGANGVRFGSNNGKVQVLTDEELDSISYVYKRIG